MVAFAEVYVDESYQLDAPLLCVAGYVFRRGRAGAFQSRWGAYLNDEKRLPYFHMTDCAVGEGVFKGRPDNDQIERRLIKETKKWSEYGFAVVVDREAFKEELAGAHGMVDTAYGFALMAAVVMVRNWCVRTGFSGKLSYFFEQGHQSRTDAERFLANIYNNPVVAERYGYYTHAFLPKETLLLHPADLLAWQWRLESVRHWQAQRGQKRRPTRKDLQALLRPQCDSVMNYTATAYGGYGSYSGTATYTPPYMISGMHAGERVTIKMANQKPSDPSYDAEAILGHK